MVGFFVLAALGAIGQMKDDADNRPSSCQLATVGEFHRLESLGLWKSKEELCNVLRNWDGNVDALYDNASKLVAVAAHQEKLRAYDRSVGKN